MMYEAFDYDMKFRMMGPLYMRRLEMFIRKDLYR